MMRHATISLLAWMACMGASRPGLAEGQFTRHPDELRCGDVTARLRTTCVEQLSMGWECVSPSLRVTHCDGIMNDIPLDIRRVPTPGGEALDGNVTNWACIRSQSGWDYLLLFYTCQRLGVACRTLNPDPEWDQIIDSTGHTVAGGRNGSEPGLLKRLGLGDLLHDGIHATGVGPNGQRGR
jgi:hypothetical protein